MKKFIYHYTCLLLSAVQFIIVLATIIEYVETSIMYGIDEADIAGIIVILICLIVLALLDKALRKIDDGNFYFDLLKILLVSPVRLIFQIITVVRLHIAVVKGDDEFGKRGSNNTFYYILFNEPGHPKKSRKQLERDRIYQDIVNRMNNEYISAENFIKSNRRSDGRYNVHIIPLCSVDDKDISTFSVQNNSYHGERYITELYVNGEKIIYDVQFQNTIALSLKPGKYDFKVVVKGEVKPIMVTKKIEKVNKTFTLNNVYVGEQDVHLVVGLIYGSVITQYIREFNYNREVVREEFEYFKQNTFFKQLSLPTLTVICDYWMAYTTKVDQVYSQYSLMNRK